MANTAKQHQPVEPAPTYYTGKKEVYVRDMFAGIADKYDLLNFVLSFNQDKAWRRLAVRLAKPALGSQCLDVCTGTGDFAIDLANAVGAHGHIIGSDFCEPMIRNGLHKTLSASAPITMMVADCEQLPYPSHTFEVVTVGFGIRNVAHIEKAVGEMARVASHGGRVVILEFNRPLKRWYKPFIDFYLFHVLPRIGGLLSRKEAYRYLPESMKHFVSREKLSETMQTAGLTDIQVHDLNFGTVCIHIGTKPMKVTE